MYFFEKDFVCPKCASTKRFYVYGRSDANERNVNFTSEFKPAKDWQVIEDKVKVSMYCDKCWETFHQVFDFEGNPIGESKWAD